MTTEPRLRSIVVFISVPVLVLGAVVPFGLGAVMLATAAVPFAIEWFTGPLRFGDGINATAFVIGAVIFAAALGAVAFAAVAPRAAELPPPARRLDRFKLWVWQRPWWMSGFAFVLIARLTADGRDTSPNWSAAFVIAFGLWLVSTAVLLVFRGLRWLVRSLVWAARRSLIAASALVIASVGTVIAWSLLLVIGAVAAAVVRDQLQHFRAALAEHAAVGPSLPLSKTKLQPYGGSSPLAVWRDGGDDEHPALIALTDAGEEGDGLFDPQAANDTPLNRCLGSLSEGLRRRAVEAARRWGASDDAEDVIQNTLIAVCLKKKPPDQAPEYFFKAVEYSARNLRRRADRQCDLDQLPETVCPIDTGDEYLKKEGLNLVHTAQCSLTIEDRELLRLRLAEDMPFKDIGERLKVSDRAAQKRYAKAVERVRGRVEELCPEFAL